MLISKLIGRSQFLLKHTNKYPQLFINPQPLILQQEQKTSGQFISKPSIYSLSNFLQCRSSNDFKGLNNRLRYNFATIGQLKQYANFLNSIDSLTIDRICQYFQQNQGLHSQQTIIKQIEKIYQSQTNTQNSYQDAKKIYLSIKQIYQSCSRSQVGFLRGDIYSNSFHSIEKHIYKVIQKKMSKINNLSNAAPPVDQIQVTKTEKQILNQNLSKQEYRNILNLITNPISFRLPDKGIKNRDLQVKKNLLERQLILEQVSTEQAFQKFYLVLDSLKKIDRVHMLQAVKKHIIQWFTPVCKAIKDQQLRYRSRQRQYFREQDNSDEAKQKKYYQQYLIKLNPQKIASLAISQLMRHIMNVMLDNNKRISPDKSFNVLEFTSISWKALCTSICKVVNGQYVYQKQQRKFKQCQKIFDKIKMEWAQKRLKNNMKRPSENNQQQLRFQNQYKQINSLNLDYRYVKQQNRKTFLNQLANKILQYPKNQIPEEIQAKIASLLIFVMKQTIKIKNKYGFRIPLVTQQVIYKKKGKGMISQKILKIDQFFLDNFLPQLQKQGDLTLHLDRSLPTLTEPLPWLEYQIGGYYLQSTTVMRFCQCSLQSRLVKYADLSRVYSVLNYLSNIPWKINHKVLNLVQKIWEQGGSQGQIPKRYSQIMNTYIMKLKQQKNYKIQRQLSAKIQKLRDQHSLRSNFILNLNIARSFSRLDRFYFPHNLDFRGRVYPIPPHLNHISSDLQRGLLQFANGRKLGKNGLKWLKVHCANLMGNDKATISQKLLFIESNLEHIRVMAQNPLKQRQWLQYEDCWQAISAIMQLNSALKHPNPSEFVSNMHVHQDGSCNGLQHYAALGRDIQGAYQVNLGPTQRPGDVYTHVAKMVIKLIQQDIKNPDSPDHKLAKQLSDKIKRKTIKQTVMTSVYGVTFIGARQQIYKQLKNQNFMQEQQTHKASIYVTKLTLKSISSLFQSAHEIKKWLIKCAKMVVETNNPMGWITPMGLPIVQPYRIKSKFDQITTIAHTLTANLNTLNLPVNKLKQQSAFPPNFVHSLDSTHMMYTAQKCRQNGLTFAAVHDSYWTHAGDVQTMNGILRQQFVKMHSQPLLQNLKVSLQRRYPQIKFPNIPNRGQFDLQKVKESIYFFS